MALPSFLLRASILATGDRSSSMTRSPLRGSILATGPLATGLLPMKSPASLKRVPRSLLKRELWPWGRATAWMPGSRRSREMAAVDFMAAQSEGGKRTKSLCQENKSDNKRAPIYATTEASTAYKAKECRGDICCLDGLSTVACSRLPSIAEGDASPNLNTARLRHPLGQQKSPEASSKALYKRRNCQQVIA